MKHLDKYKEQAGLCNLFYYDLVEFVKNNHKASRVTISRDFYRICLALPVSLRFIDSDTQRRTIAGLPYDVIDQKEPYIFHK